MTAPGERSETRVDDPVLTPREREVLQLAADGHTTSGIAHALFISQATVKVHLKNIYIRLGVHSRHAAVARAMRMGLIE